MIVPTAEITLPKASNINYANTGEVEGYSLYLLKLYERDGGFNSNRRITHQMKAVEAELRTWCVNVKGLLMDAPLSDIHRLIASFDLPYRVVYRQAPSDGFMRQVRINAVQRWAKGDKSISSTVIAKILWDEIYSRNFKTLENKYGLYYFGLIDGWVKELQRTGAFAGTPPIDTYSRLKILMTEDLYAQYGSKGADQDKRKWAKSHQVKDISALDTPTLRSYIGFSTAASHLNGIPIKRQLANYIRFHTELDGRNDIDPYLHAALKIDISLKQAFLQELN